MFNPITSIPAVAKLLAESNRILRNEKEAQRLRDAGDIEGEKALLQRASGEWATRLSEKLQVTYEIHGEENIPEKGPVMIYSNHQGLADILALYYVFRNHFQIGFISKSEWRKVRFLRRGVEFTRSIFLDRGNSRAALEAIRQACDYFDDGFSLVIFPEGTRSRGHQMGEFKHGAFKFAQKGKVPILPITLEGSYHIYEEFNTYHPCHIVVNIHPLVHIENMNRQDQAKAFKDIEDTIRNGFVE